MNEKQFFYAQAGKKHGPVGFQDLRQLAQQGELRRDDKIWSKDMSNWQPAGSVREIFDNLPPDFVAEAALATAPSKEAVGSLARQRDRLPQTDGPSFIALHKMLAVLGIIACLMVLFPPIQTYHDPVVLEDRGLAWQLGGGQPDLIIADAGGYRNRRFKFLLTLQGNDKIILQQLAVQLVLLLGAGCCLVAWRGKKSGHGKVMVATPANS